MLITAIAPLGDKYRLQLIPEFDGAGNVTVVVLFSLKSTDINKAAPRPLSFSGTIAEVEAAIATELVAAVGKLVSHALTLEGLDAELAKEVEAKKAAASKDTAAVTAAKPAGATNKRGKRGKKADGQPPSADDDAEGEGDDEPEATAAPKRDANDPTPTPSLPSAPGLTPAWKAPATPPPATDPATPTIPDDDAALFN